MIRLVVLGTSGSMPTPKSPPSCFGVKWGGVYLFDACEGVQRQMMKFDLSFAAVKCLFLSHLHADHFLGIFGLVHSLNFTGRKETLYIYGPKGTKRFLSQTFAMREFQPDFPVEIIEVAAGKKAIYENDLFAVRAFAVKHNAPAALGYVLEGLSYRRFDEQKARAKGVHGYMFSELQRNGKAYVDKKMITYKSVTYVQPGKKIVYTGDTMQCPAIAAAAKNADLLIHDSCFSDKHKDHAKAKTHSTALDAAKNAKKAKVKKLLLTHFSNRYEDQTPLLDEAKSVFEHVELAHPGKEILL